MRKIHKNSPKKRVKKELDRKSVNKEINKILGSFLFNKMSEFSIQSITSGKHYLLSNPNERKILSTKNHPSKINVSLESKKIDLEKILESSKEKIKKFRENISSESEYIFMHRRDAKEEKINIRYEIKKEEKDEKKGISYGVNITYQNSSSEEKVEASVDFEDSSRNKGSYSLSIKQDKNDKKYFIDVKYKENKKETSLHYIIPLQSYKEQLLEQKQDFTKLADKSLHILPESMMGGVLGFTYLGENYMARRADITGSKALMVDTHEAIHTPDEYETRILTDWMLSRPKMNYKR